MSTGVKRRGLGDVLGKFIGMLLDENVVGINRNVTNQASLN